MERKLIKKYQQPWGSNGIQPLPSSWEEAIQLLNQDGARLQGNTNKYGPQTFNENFLKTISNPSVSPSTYTPNLGAMKQSSPSGQIAPIKIKPIGSALAEDATRVKKATDAAGIAAKAASAAKFASGMNVASALVDPALQLTEGIATSLGANFAEKDAASGAVDAISGVASMFGPVGQGIGIGLKALDFVDRAAGKNVKGFQGNTGLSAYTDFSTQGRKFRATQKGKAKGLEASKKEGQQFYGNAMQIKGQQEQLKTASVDLAQKNQFNRINQLGGIDTTRGILAKKGTKLQLLNIKARANYNFSKKQQGELIPEVISEVIEEQIDSFENGGAFNVIPEGALHAHKHSIEDSDDEMTTKGIPVITIEEGGKVVQHAEIERDELILNLDTSKYIEKLFKEYNEATTEEKKNEIATEAGKELVFQILENTSDKTGLIETIIK